MINVAGKCWIVIAPTIIIIMNQTAIVSETVPSFVMSTQTQGPISRYITIVLQKLQLQGVPKILSVIFYILLMQN